MICSLQMFIISYLCDNLYSVLGLHHHDIFFCMSPVKYCNEPDYMYLLSQYIHVIIHVMTQVADSHVTSAL